MENSDPKARMYFIAIVLPKHLDENVLAYKKWMQELYGCKVGLKSPAHITIVPPFWMNEEKENPLRQDMEDIAKKISSFKLLTNDFSAFQQRTIFVAVQESVELKEAKKRADEFFRRSAYGMKIEGRPFHPHITIATRDLHKKDFAEAWPRFQAMELRKRFEAVGLSLLKHNGRRWDVVFTAAFGSSLQTNPAAHP